MVVDIKPHKSQFNNSNCTITQSEKFLWHSRRWCWRATTFLYVRRDCRPRSISAHSCSTDCRYAQLSPCTTAHRKTTAHHAHYHHHHHRQPWAQCPLVSDAILTIAAHRCLSRAAWLNSCRVAHTTAQCHLTILGEAVLFCLNHPSFRTPRSLSFCCRPFCRYGRRGATFSVSLSA